MLNPTKWTSGPIDCHAISAPIPAPIKPPRLKKPCSELMMLRPARDSISIPCAFMDKSSPPLPIPKTTSESIRVHGFGMMASKGSAAKKSNPNMSVVRAEPMESISRPAIGNEINAPTAIPIITVPMLPVPMPSSPTMAGTLLTHAESVSPLSKKMMDIARRALSGLMSDVKIDPIWPYRR